MADLAALFAVAVGTQALAVIGAVYQRAIAWSRAWRKTDYERNRTNKSEFAR